MCSYTAADVRNGGAGLIARWQEERHLKTKNVSHSVVILGLSKHRLAIAICYSCPCCNCFLLLRCRQMQNAKRCFVYSEVQLNAYCRSRRSGLCVNSHFSLLVAVSTRAKLLLTCTRNFTQFEYSLSSAGYLSLTHYFSVTCEYQKLPFWTTFLLQKNMGFTSTTVT